jgi:anti-anti-sigma factor
MAESSLQVAPIGPGYLIRITGRGTLRESPTLKEFVMKCSQHGESTVVIDLMACSYLDSTFLGCLVTLHKGCNRESTSRLFIHVEPERRKQLFSVCRLEKLLSFTETCPTPIGEFVEIQRHDLDCRELGKHAMISHLRLAEIGGEDARSFKSVADQLAEELGDANE